MRPAAFLFDLDGTLVDTETMWARAIVDFVADHGGKAELGEVLSLVVGRNWLDIDRVLHGRFPELGDASPMDDARELRLHFNRHALHPESMVIPGSVRFFREVSALAPCAIVSGSPHQDVVAAARLCGLEDCLSLVLGAGEYAAGKPSPSGYLRAAELLKVEPAACVAVEDSTVGIASALAAGMRVVALDRAVTVRPDCTGATWRVGDLSELDVAKEFA